MSSPAREQSPPSISLYSGEVIWLKSVSSYKVLKLHEVKDCQLTPAPCFGSSLSRLPSCHPPPHSSLGRGVEKELGFLGEAPEA